MTPVYLAWRMAKPISLDSRRWEPRIINYIEHDRVDFELKDSSTKPSSENRRFL